MRQWVRLLFLGLCVALIASALARMLQPESASRPRAVAVDVVVAARDLSIGHVLAEGDLALERVPDGPKARTGLTLVAAAVGRTTSVAVRKGQLIREEDLASPGMGASLASLVPPGQRAITVALRDPGPGPALFPGAFVDVLVTADIPSKASGFREAMTKTVIERSRVLAVNDQGIGARSAGPSPAAASVSARDRAVALDGRERRPTTRNPTITLLVTPEQAAQLELASVRGTIGIALCASADGEAGVPSPPAITTSSMLGISLEPDPPAAPPAPPEAPEPKPEAKPVAEPEGQESAAPPEPAKPQVWEVVVVRGDSTVKHPFPAKEPSSPDAGGAAPGGTSGPRR